MVFNIHTLFIDDKAYTCETVATVVAFGDEVWHTTENEASQFAIGTCSAMKGVILFVVQPVVSQSLPTFTLPDLLSTPTWVMLDQRTGTVLVLRLEASFAAPLVGVCQLRPSAAKLFLALLQAYPQTCSHQHLFSTLYGDQREKCQPVWDPASGLKAIRRALFWLSSGLRFVGLEAVAVRGRGYILAAATAPDERELGSAPPPVTTQAVPSFSPSDRPHWFAREHERHV